MIKIFHNIRKIFAINIIIFLTLILPVGQGQARSLQTVRASSTGDPMCRFAITTPTGIGGYDMTPFRVGSYLDWGFNRSPSAPANVEYIHVLRVGDYEDRYNNTLANLDAIVTANPGAYWSVGNEPDTRNENQDGILAALYAQRFFTIATRIRTLDPTARIGFGAIVQPTPIRLRYLNLAWTELAEQAGSPEGASALIDFWTIHAFVLNEIPGQWGAGVPPGFDNDHADAIHITNYADTYSVSLFKARVKSFRSWMEEKGERSKSLWITEYGSLFPPIDPPGGPDLVNVTDANSIIFMKGSFDFMLNGQDAATGMPSDNNHLVQRWFWYSLNDHRYTFGGSLYDPDKSGHPLTAVGTAWFNYVKDMVAAPELALLGSPELVPDPVDPDRFLMHMAIANAGTANDPEVHLWIFPDSMQNPALSVLLESIPGCGEVTHLTASVPYPAEGYERLVLLMDTNRNDAPDTGDWRMLMEAPPVPVNLQAAPQSRTRIHLQWEDAAGETGYRLDRSLDGGLNWSSLTELGADVTSYTDTGLDCAVNYVYRIQAFDDAGEWGFSNNAGAMTDGCDSPALNASSSSRTRINLTWTDTLATESGYYVERSEDGTSGWSRIATSAANAEFYSDASLDCGQTRYYRLQPFNAYGTWSYSAPVSTSTLGCSQLPYTPGGVAATPYTCHAILVSWNNQDDGMHIERSANGISDWVEIVLVDPTEQSYLDGGLDYNATFYYRLRAQNPNGSSDYSSIVSATTYSFIMLLPLIP